MIQVVWVDDQLNKCQISDKYRDVPINVISDKLKKKGGIKGG